MGSLADSKILVQIGLKEDDLRKGIKCVVGDFDGNGYLDFAFYGRIIHELPVVDHPESLGVIFYQGPRVLQANVLKNPYFTSPEIYPATDKKGQFGEPISKTDGIVEWGQGGATVIYLFNPKTGLMEGKIYPSEDDI